MTPAEINAAIAEIVRPVAAARTIQVTTSISADPIEGTLTVTMTPNYHGDLNACAQFEATITDHHMIHRYRSRLHGNVSATAPQRCEAFLRTHGKWRGE